MLKMTHHIYYYIFLDYYLFGERMIEDKDWNGMYNDTGRFVPMDSTSFHIFRVPTTSRYRKALAKFRLVEQEEIDKRWNLWHYWFKRRLLYGPVRWLLSNKWLLRFVKRLIKI